MVIGSTAAAAAQDFYTGKSIRLIVATTPGGGFAAYSRMLARHMERRIPGNPTFVVENMPGARFPDRNQLSVQAGQADGLTLGNWIAPWFYIKLREEKALTSMRAGSNTSVHRPRIMTPA